VKIRISNGPARRSIAMRDAVARDSPAMTREKVRARPGAGSEMDTNITRT
jgi:hypothetical protein